MNRVFVLSLVILSAAMLSGCFGRQAAAPVTLYGGSEGEGSAGVHVVLEGDTLWSISKRYRLAMRDIAIENNMGAPFALKPGERLKLPPPLKYTVREGDTLYSISRMFGVGRTEIASLNNLSPPYTLYKGDELRLPSSAWSDEDREGAGALAGSDAPVTPGAKPPRTAAKKSTKPPPPRITATTPKRSSGKFLKPVSGEIVSSYGPKKNGLHNDGINIRAPRGTPVRSAENGVVVYAGSELKGSGNLVLVRHEDRWMTAYAHMDKLKVKRGQVLKRGQTLGTVGSTGSVDSPQLHFEVRRGTKAINPVRYLESR